MRHPTAYVGKDGLTTYKIRYRSGGAQTSQTFRKKADATRFAAILDAGGVADALAWLDARDRKASTYTFGEWFEVYVDQLTGVQSRTRDDYRAQQRRYLGHLGDLPLPLITRGHVTDVVNRLDRDGKSPKTIKNVVHMLSSSLGLAIDEGHISRNPCRRVRLPARKVGTVEARFLTFEEFRHLARHIDPHYQALVIFLVGTGLRWSEATALQCRHVDIANGTVRVEQAWKRVAGGWEIGAPKTDKSRRTVNPAAMALGVVADLLTAPKSFVFTTPRGNVIRHANFYNRVWRPACEAAGMDPAPRPHDLRHSHASWLISDGQQLEAVQDQLGHESILTTRAVYGHLLPALGVAVGRSASASLELALPDGPQSLIALPAIQATGDPDQ